MIHQRVAHQAGGHSEKMVAVFPLNGGVWTEQAQPRLIDQSRGLESIVGAASLQISSGQEVEFPLNPRSKLRQRRAIALAPPG